MGHATKGGMYCLSCDKPVAAVKTTHGVRNTLALPTMGLTAKVEGWHCPTCGGPVKPAWQAQREKRKRAEKQTAEMAAWREVEGVGEVVIQPTKKRLRLRMALTDAGVESNEAKELVNESQAGNPIRVHPEHRSQAGRLVQRLKGLGCEYELVRGEPHEGGVAAPSGEEEAAASGSAGNEPAQPSNDIFGQIERLGQLHEAGVLTDEEFQTKKAELLARL
jgi:hypothetical protein